MTKFISVSTLMVLVSGCGAATPEPAEPASEARVAEAPEPQKQEEAALAEEEEMSPDAEESELELTAAMPTQQCEEGAECVPPAEFSKEFCKGRYPGLAVNMFEKNTPWKRMYVQVETLEHVNTYGGITTKNLEFTEEVIILRHQSSGSGGITIAGASDVDVLRWDGTCATVREELLSEHRMPTIKNATVTWKYLDKQTREGLLQAKYVRVRYGQQRDACRRSSASNPSDQCQKATDKLNDAITVAVRGGMDLPEPGELPVWKPVE